MRFQRKYTINQNYFEIIDTEEKAYWLGFLYADGSVTKDRVITLQLSICDIEVVKNFNEVVTILDLTSVLCSICGEARYVRDLCQIHYVESKKENMKRASKKWYQNNKERKREYIKEWKKNRKLMQDGDK